MLAAFNSSDERGYLNLLEAIFTFFFFIFLFGALLKPPFESDYVNKSTWKLYEKLYLGKPPLDIVRLSKAKLLTYT